jgi:hypothetical protein
VIKPPLRAQSPSSSEDTTEADMLVDEDSKGEDGRDDDLDLIDDEAIIKRPAPRTVHGRKTNKADRAKANDKRGKGKTVKVEPKIEPEETPGTAHLYSLLLLFTRGPVALIDSISKSELSAICQHFPDVVHSAFCGYSSYFIFVNHILREPLRVLLVLAEIARLHASTSPGISLVCPVQKVIREVVLFVPLT